MTITRNFKLCLNAGTQNAPYINANQYDEGEEWVFDLYTEGGQKFTPSTGAIIGIKSDGNAILNSGTVNSDGQVVITETQQMTAASGLAVFELLIEGETHGTANFIVNVERRPSDDAEFSDSDLSMLQEAIDAAEVINEILDEGGDPSEIIAENVNNWLDNHPEATTTVEDGAITAPKINNSLWDKILVNEEVSGNPASFDDGADDVPVSSLKVALEPIQTGSGDPSPTNIRPIIASNGKNVLPLTVASCQTNSTAGTWDGNVYTHLGVTYTLNTGADGTVESVTMNGTSTGASELRIALVSFDPTKTYKVNGITGATSSTYRFNIGGVGTYYDNDYSVTFEDTSEHIGRLQVPNGVEVSNATVQPMIRLDGTDATFQPYQGIIVERTGENVSPVSYPISLGREVYGGTVDLTTGVLTVAHALDNIDGTTNLSYNGLYAGLGTEWVYAPTQTKAYGILNMQSDRFKTLKNVGVYGYVYGRDSNGKIYFSLPESVTTTALMHDWFTANPTQIMYELATPHTVQLTPTEVKTLLGYNNISSSGTVEVIYHADTKLYIDKKIGELS